MLKLEIVTPEKRVFDAEVDSVTVPTTTGEAGILPNHAPLISALKPGILSYSVKGVSEKFAVAGGFVEVNANKVAVLADTAETSEEIDLNAAKADRENAEKALSAAASGSLADNEAVREQLAAANVRISLASGK
jgi:F-type H+-transporting ATPase subunit epsilon